MSKTVRDGSVEDHSRGIRKTLTEIDKILDELPLDDAGPLRTKLRDAMTSAFDDLSLGWYKKGLNRGHKVACREFEKTGEVPEQLKTDKKRQFRPNGDKHQVKLKSALK
jgi:hypothetical protein